MNHFLLKIVLIFLFVITANASVSLRQSNSKMKKPDSCEIVGVKLDAAAIEFEDSSSNDSYFLIIGGAAKGEKNIYNRRRIADALKYFALFYKFDKDQIIYGGSAKSADLGYLQLYVGGKRISEIYFAKNSKLCFGIGEIFSR